MRIVKKYMKSFKEFCLNENFEINKQYLHVFKKYNGLIYFLVNDNEIFNKRHYKNASLYKSVLMDKDSIEFKNLLNGVKVGKNVCEYLDSINFEYDKDSVRKSNIEPTVLELTILELKQNRNNFEKDFIQYLVKDLKMFKYEEGYYSVEDLSKFDDEEEFCKAKDLNKIKLGMIYFYLEIEKNRIVFKISDIESHKKGLGLKMLNKIKELIYKYEDFYLKIDNRFVLDIGSNANIEFWNKFQVENQDLLIIDTKK